MKRVSCAKCVYSERIVMCKSSESLCHLKRTNDLNWRVILNIFVRHYWRTDVLHQSSTNYVIIYVNQNVPLGKCKISKCRDDGKNVQPKGTQHFFFHLIYRDIITLSFAKLF